MNTCHSYFQNNGQSVDFDKINLKKSEKKPRNITSLVQTFFYYSVKYLMSAPGAHSSKYGTFSQSYLKFISVLVFIKLDIEYCILSF